MTSVAAIDYVDLVGDELRIATILGMKDLTYDEMQAILDILPQTVAARCNGLMQKGLIERTGEQRPTRRGRNAAVWTLVRVADRVYDEEAEAAYREHQA